MVRKTRALWLASLTAGLVVGMAAAFAGLRNAGAPPSDRVAAAPKGAQQPHPGQRVFERLNCGMCHSIGGAGSPDGRLDGVGARLSREELRAWTTGTGVAGDKLPPGVVRRKATALKDPELEVLLDYLQRSR